MELMGLKLKGAGTAVASPSHLRNPYISTTPHSSTPIIITQDGSLRPTTLPLRRQGQDNTAPSIQHHPPPPPRWRFPFHHPPLTEHHLPLHLQHPRRQPRHEQRPELHPPIPLPKPPSPPKTIRLPNRRFRSFHDRQTFPFILIFSTGLRCLVLHPQFFLPSHGTCRGE